MLESFSTMLAGVLCLAVLLGAWLVTHVRAGGTPLGHAGAGGWASARAPATLGVLVACAPLLRLAPGFEARPQVFWGDMTSHARVAAEIARTGLPNGWIDSYMGGFPVGHHYPPLGWLVLAGSIRCGAPPGLAVTALGLLAALALVLALHAALLRVGVAPWFAALGAVLVCWVSPYNSFVGGYETFFTAGLVSQVLVMPLCTWLVAVTLRPGRGWQAPVFAWLSMAAHPQVTVAALVVLCLAALASGKRAAITSSAATGLYAALAGLSLYGQGIATLRIPFGWPPDLGWRQLGFRPPRLQAWLLDGDLLDYRRPPVMTSLLVAALLLLSLTLRRAAHRALVCGLVVSLALAVSGHWLQSLGQVGRFLLSFLQPLRAMSLVPPLAAAAIAVGLQHGAGALSAALVMARRERLARAVPPATVLLGLALAAVGLPARLAYTSDVLAAQRSPTLCSGAAPETAGYDHARVRAWLEHLSGGRLWYEAHRITRLEMCLGLGGVDLFSAVPTGTAAAVGAHVGVLSRAAQLLELRREGSAARAEALGIGYALTGGGDEAPPAGWALRQRSGRVQLLEQPALPVGVGCVRERWVGSPEHVRLRLESDLARPEAADRLLDPHHFTAIEYGGAEVVVSAAPAEGCDARGARVLAASAEAGQVWAEVESQAPVEVVFRFSAFPTWRVETDGVAAPPARLIAPGFFSVRVPPGRHLLTARVSLLPHYGAFIALAMLATAGLAALEWRLRRARGRAAAGGA